MCTLPLKTPLYDVYFDLYAILLRMRRGECDTTFAKGGWYKLDIRICVSIAILNPSGPSERSKERDGMKQMQLIDTCIAVQHFVKECAQVMCS